MKPSNGNTYNAFFPNCRRILGNQTWGRILAALDNDTNPQDFPGKLDYLKSSLNLPEHLSDLARVEWALFQVKSDPGDSFPKCDTIAVNPTLKLVKVGWKQLPTLITLDPDRGPDIQPSNDTFIMVWRHPKTGISIVREAEDADLLSLKITVEKTEPRTAAAIGGVMVGAIENALRRSMTQGILIPPRSLIRREFSPEQISAFQIESFLSADTFTLQWHITQNCDLRCRHCYDRSRRSSLPYKRSVAVLDDFYSFCKKMHVRGQVSFTGGNPLLYPRFKDVYQEAVDRGFGTAVLGNPGPVRDIQDLVAIAKPSFFQISLEGLGAHNDHIRGKGHFKRSLEFLDQLRNLDIFTMVMLTLTNDNIHQVLPLAELLRDRVDFFTFNRLSSVGEGAQLLMVKQDEFQAFLHDYHAASPRNPILGFKDNLINIVRQEEGGQPFGGCTGYGCGAAFNFVALLPDGEVHACRKFPSFIGNICDNRLMDIYHSAPARKYRKGSRKCSDCTLNTLCRGCLAITHSYGLDVFEERDPYCFMTPKQVKGNHI